MSTFDEDLFEDLFITFDELLQMKQEDIPLCVDKYSAITICESSSATPGKIYNLWVQKLFKAYNAEGFTSKDWHTIIEYLEKNLWEFVKNFNISDEKSCKELEQWWLDSQDLLKWMETIINSLDMYISCLIMTYVLEIIMETCKFSNKRNFKALCAIQQLVVNISNNSLFKKSIKDEKEMENFDKILSSLCDVGSLISSVDLKTSVETWRAVAKLSEKLFNLNLHISFIDSCSKPKKLWSEKAILGICKELTKILRIFDQNPYKNENLLQIAQFYLKILKVIINYSKEITNSFSATKELIDLYTFCQHEMIAKKNPKIENFVKKPFFDIFALVFKENSIKQAVLQHVKYDVVKFESCSLVFNYLALYIDHCKTSSLKLDIEMVLKVYNGLLEGPLIFIDKDKYGDLLKHYVSLLVIDSSSQLHQEFCKYVVDLSLIRAYTSMEILSIYYSYIFNQQNPERDSKCLQFWFIMWNKFNMANATFRQNKKFIEVLLKSILKNVPNNQQKNYNFDKYENNEIILLKSGKQNEKCQQFFSAKLRQNLNKMQQRRINGVVYKELLNLLEICILIPQLLDDFLKENLLTIFMDLLKIPASDLQKFQEFIDLCFGIFNQQLKQQQNEKLLKYLLEHENQCLSIQSTFFVEFLLKQKPLSNKLIKSLTTSNNLTSTIVNFIDCEPSNNLSVDLKIFKDLKLTPQQSNNALEKLSKRPRLDEGNFSNIKTILNDLNKNSLKLLNFPCSVFDDNDIELMRSVKNTIEKCLPN